MNTDGHDVLGWVVQGTVQNKTAKIGAKQQTLQQITCIVTESTSQIPVLSAPICVICG
jgi:hypothetical protein